MKITFAPLLLIVALPVAAQEMEQLLLPVSPSVVMCDKNSRYETRLITYNQSDRAVRPRCADDSCGVIPPAEGREIAGAAQAVPLPSFLFLPKDQADKLRMSLVAESGDRDHPEDRSFSELPIVRASEFRDTKVTFVGVRLDEGFRQTVRIFGLDGTRYDQVAVRVYDLATEKLLYDEPMLLFPLTDEQNASGQALRPSFSMECDLSSELPPTGGHVRIEIEPLTEGLKFWAFVSVTNNKTQHFYTVVPR